MLTLLERLVAGFWDVIRRVIGLVLPFFSQKREYKGMSDEVRAILHFFLLLLIVLGLYAINRWFGLARWVDAPAPFGISLRNWWLSILFLLIYALFWLGYWLWKLLGPEEEVSAFPDIDAAWEEICGVLDEKGIGVSEAPLFMVLGKPTAGELAVFEAAHLNFTVKQVPRGPEAPIHAYANRDGIYLTCSGASLIGRMAQNMSGEWTESAPGGGGGDDEDDNEEDALYKTIGGEAAKGAMPGVGSVKNILDKAREDGRGPDQLNEQERDRIRILVQQDEQKKSKPRTSLVRNVEAMDHALARFRHFCRLIVRDRRPFCPINGILVMIPLAATDSDEDAKEAITICQREMQAAREILQLSCPTFAMVCDLETAPGFSEFFERFPADQRQRRMGQRFPLAPDLDQERVPAMVEGGVGWICEGVFPAWIYKQLGVETGDDEEAEDFVQSNNELFKFLASLHGRRRHLARVVGRGLASQPEHFFFGGCYVAGTSLDEAAFVPGVFRRLTEHQSAVAWTPEAINEDADYQRWTRYGYTGMGLVTLIVVALILFNIMGK